MRRRDWLVTLVPAAVRLRGQQRGKQTMKVELQLSSKQVVGGEALLAQLLLRNHTNQPLEIDAGRTAPVRFDLRRSGDDNAVPLSPEQFSESLRTGRPVRDIRPVLRTLAPGETYTMTSDLAELALETLEPGTWHAIGYWNDAPSNEVAFEVVAPQSSLFTLAYCRYSNSPASVFDHCDTAGCTLLQRDKGMFWARVGTHRRRTALPGGPGPVFAAPAVFTAPRLQGRWSAWLRGNNIGAVQTSQTVRLAELGAAQLPEPAAGLVSPAFNGRSAKRCSSY